ncbi:MAG: TRAP transporter small permease subunit [Victivallales bacterium]|nr:TRAP transporter small permease subunit [Victivallales bacterium]
MDLKNTSKRSRPRADHILVAAIFAAMVLIAFVNILGRYVFHYSLSFTEELTVNMFVWLTVLCSGIAFERGAHLGVNVLHRLFPPAMKRFVAFLTAFLAAALFLVVDIMLVKSANLEWTLFHSTSPSLSVPVWIYYVVVVALTPWVFRGIYRELRGKLRKLDANGSNDAGK